jgi:hypothetical protein
MGMLIKEERVLGGMRGTGQNWKDRDPIEDRLFHGSDPDAHVSEMEDVIQEIEKTKKELNGESVKIARELMETVVRVRQVSRKAKRLESEALD